VENQTAMELLALSTTDCLEEWEDESG